MSSAQSTWMAMSWVSGWLMLSLMVCCWLSIVVFKEFMTKCCKHEVDSLKDSLDQQLHSSQPPAFHPHIRRTNHTRERNAHLVKPICYSRNTKTRYCSWRIYMMLASILPSDQLSGLNTRRIHNPKKINAHLIKPSCYSRNTKARCCYSRTNIMMAPILPSHQLSTPGESTTTKGEMPTS